ncbi:reverse transcriptase [Plakobranchus ocellatus]|uniref:Reverse transcriptase n=1 Tax=Plakobranchus ocellatus TaxID=259542 RepID=A0AAV4CUE4_9GAST|nr:reverse transcriptase [Plakobranchus ocellatus]
MPKLVWSFLVSLYVITNSTVEFTEAEMNKFTRRWLGVPPGLADVAMYCYKVELKLPLESIVGEAKCGKAKLITMLKDSENPAMRSIQPNLRNSRKWRLEAVNRTKEGVKMKEAIGLARTGRKWLGSERSVVVKIGMRRENDTLTKSLSKKIPQVTFLRLCEFTKQFENSNKDNGQAGKTHFMYLLQSLILMKLDRSMGEPSMGHRTQCSAHLLQEYKISVKENQNSLE